MAVNRLDELVPDIPTVSGKVILEYVFLNLSRTDILDQTRVVSAEPRTVEDCPIWNANLWNRPDQVDSEEMILKPVAMFENPFLKSPHKLVMCDVWVSHETPADFNTRVGLTKTLQRLERDSVTGYQPKQAHEPWFGIEQEYCVINEDGVPVSYDPENFNYDTLVMYNHVGHRHCKHIGSERELSSRHLMACLYAGLEIGGRVRENGPSQWEYQIGPCEGVSIGDHLYMSRYILHRLAEPFGVRVTFKPVPVPGLRMISGGHLNFSTYQMRQEGGIRFIRHAIEILSHSYQEEMYKQYDPSADSANTQRMQSQKTEHWIPRVNEFTFGVGKKRLTTIRIPKLVDIQGCGYFEDRRPGSNLDPYAAADVLVRASILGDFLKPGFEHLKDLSLWDEL
ncbi:glutamine synthetase-like [Crassostrea virginica]